MGSKVKNILLVAALSVFPTLFVWLPFFLRVKSFWGIPLPTSGMATIVANYDGPLFLVVAKTLYNIEAIKASFQFPLPTEYYAAHFPLFPLLIRIFSVAAGYPYSMLFVTVVSSFLALYFFYKLSLGYLDESKARWLTFVFAIFPARWLIVRSVGSAEPLFIASILASIFYYKKKSYLLSGIWGALAQFTKSPAILLFVAYLLDMVFPQLKQIGRVSLSRLFKNLELEKKYPIFFIPLALLGIFILFKFTFGNFWAYFRSGDNIHLFFPPFSIFNYSAPWVGTFWLEEVIFIYLVSILGLTKLIAKGWDIVTFFVGIFLISILFVSHRDLLRYALPIIPFLLIAFSDTITRKKFRWVIALLVIPIYLFSLAYISQNVMPISNWAPFL